MPSKPDPENGVPAPTDTQRHELADVLAEIRESRESRDLVPESVRVTPSKPVSRQTARLLNKAWADFQRDCNEIAHDAAQDEGIDESVFKLVAFTGPPAHWAPK